MNWKAGDKALIEVEVVMVGQNRTWVAARPVDAGEVTSVYVSVDHLRPVPAAGEVEAATDDVNHDDWMFACDQCGRKVPALELWRDSGAEGITRLRQLLTVAGWECDDAAGTDTCPACVSAGDLLGGGVPGRSEAEDFVRPLWPRCKDHREVQHRDGKPPWCERCGWNHGRPAVPAQQVRAAQVSDTEGGK